MARNAPSRRTASGRTSGRAPGRTSGKTAPKNAPRKPPRRAPAGEPIDITTFSTAVRYLHDRVDIERLRVVRYDEEMFKLDRMRSLLKRLGDPHEQIRSVHVAGTVGKGSTVAMLAGMLQACGYAVGRYTSPHLIDVRERISIGESPISRNEFTEVMKEVSAAAGSGRAGDADHTFFELLTAAALVHFAEQAVDIAVIETGLGGRLDSTNVITPEISLITTIDYDHTHLLGRTLERIATEKAGIFKRGVPAMSVEQPSAQVEQVLRRRAEAAGTTLKVVNKDIEFSSRFGVNEELGPHTRVCLLTQTSQFMHIPVPLPGEHQAGNCGLALAVVDYLKTRGFDFPEIALHQGLASAKAPGRMDVLRERPRILADGAHNAASLSALMRCVGAYMPYDSMVCVFGCCQDKHIAALLECVSLGADKVIFTRAKGNARAMDPDELQRQFMDQSGKMSQVAPALPQALDLAARAVGRDDLIVVTGSFYLVGEAKKYLAELDRKRG